MLKKILIIGLLTISELSFSQGIEKYSENFTKYDLYKWRNEMKFKPKFLSEKALDDMILSMDDSRMLDQYHMMLVVTYENYKNGDDAMMYTFKNQFKQFYGEMSNEQFSKFYIPYYVFLQIDKWAEGYIKNKSN